MMIILCSSKSLVRVLLFINRIVFLMFSFSFLTLVKKDVVSLFFGMPFCFSWSCKSEVENVMAFAGTASNTPIFPGAAFDLH